MKHPIQQCPAPPALGYVLMRQRHDRAVLVNMRGFLRHASWQDGIVCASGSFAAVEAAARLLTCGDYTVPTCITPNGRLDSHREYMRGSGVAGTPTVCVFRGE